MQPDDDDLQEFGLGFEEVAEAATNQDGILWPTTKDLSKWASNLMPDRFGDNIVSDGWSGERMNVEVANAAARAGTASAGPTLTRDQMRRMVDLPLSNLETDVAKAPGGAASRQHPPGRALTPEEIAKLSGEPLPKEQSGRALTWEQIDELAKYR